MKIVRKVALYWIGSSSTAISAGLCSLRGSLSLVYPKPAHRHGSKRGRYAVESLHRNSIEFTRCRPYRKNDQAFVEQKNGSIVRRIVGYHRYEGVEAAATLTDLYRSVRFFITSFSHPLSCGRSIAMAQWSKRSIILLQRPIRGSWQIREHQPKSEIRAPYL